MVNACTPPPPPYEKILYESLYVVGMQTCYYYTGYSVRRVWVTIFDYHLIIIL